jgi:hypothetical protein
MNEALPLGMEIVIEGNAMERYQVEAGVSQSSPVSPILFARYTSGLIKWVEDYRSEAKGLSIVDDLGWVATTCDVNHIFSIIDSCAGTSIEWASRRGLQFGTAKTEAALFTCTRGHWKYPRPKLTAKIRVSSGVRRFNIEATLPLGVWMDAHLTFKAQHNRCMKIARAAEATL